MSNFETSEDNQMSESYNYDNEQEYTEEAQYEDNNAEGDSFQVVEEANDANASYQKSGYKHDVTSGQRSYTTIDHIGPTPGSGHEVFCGKIPKGILEDELLALFEKAGPIYDLRLMMDPELGCNKGFCFITFLDKRSGEKAVQELNEFEIRPKKQLRVNITIPNKRLFVGNIPKSKTKEEILEETKKSLEGVQDVIIYANPDDPTRPNRGFCFIDFDCHKSASNSRKEMFNGRVKIFGKEVIVDWADPQDEPDDVIMSKVKVLYIRNLKADVTEEMMRDLFSPYGEIEKVKRVKDYGFVHYMERESAIKALEELNNTKINDSFMLISLAKPPIDPKTKEKRKMQHMMLMQKSMGMENYGGGYGGQMRGNRGQSRGRRAMGNRARGAPNVGRGYGRGGGGGGGYGNQQMGGYYGGEGYGDYNQGYNDYYGYGYGDEYYDDYYGYYEEDYSGYYDDYSGGYGTAKTTSTPLFGVSKNERGGAKGGNRSNAGGRGAKGGTGQRGGRGNSRGGSRGGNQRGGNSKVGSFGRGSGGNRGNANRGVPVKRKADNSGGDFGGSSTKQVKSLFSVGQQQGHQQNMQQQQTQQNVQYPQQQYGVATNGSANSWGVQPIAQQPLSSQGGYDGSEWYGY